MNSQTINQPAVAAVDAPQQNTSPSILGLEGAARQVAGTPSPSIARFRERQKAELADRLADFQENASTEEVHFLNDVLDHRESHFLASEPLGLISAFEYVLNPADYSAYLKVSEMISNEVWTHTKKLAAAAGLELHGQAPKSSSPLDGLSADDLEFVGACLAIKRQDRGCSTPAEIFITSIINYYRHGALDLETIETATSEFKDDCDLAEATIRSYAKHNLKPVESIIAAVKSGGSDKPAVSGVA